MVMLIMRFAEITLWSTLQIMQFKTKERSMDAPRVMPFYKRRISSESSGQSELKYTEDKRSKTMK